MANHVDLSPGRMKPPEIPWDAHAYEANDIWSYSAFLRMYLQYLRSNKWVNGPMYEWVILGGEFLEDVRHMSDILLLDDEVTRDLERVVQRLCCELKPGESITFEKGGNKLITSDVSATHVALTLGRFYCWYEIRGSVGPRGDNGLCPWSYEIKWTVKDDYDFDFFTKISPKLWWLEFFEFYG